MNLTNESLLAVKIKDNEIFELLERLAATDAMFQQPVSTIRDVAELTEASPDLIARTLGHMRGPTEYERLMGLIQGHEQRISHTERQVAELRRNQKTRTVIIREELEEKSTSRGGLMVVAVVAIVLIIFAVIAGGSSTSGPGAHHMATYEMTINGRKMEANGDGRVYELKNGEKILLKDDDADAGMIKAFAAHEAAKSARKE